MFSDKVVVITGGSSGIGMHLCKQLIEVNAKVLIIGRNKKKLDDNQFLGTSTRLKTLVADLSCPESPELIVKTCVSEFGRIDYLINNAGMPESGSLMEMDDTEIRNLYETNLIAPTLLIKKFLPHLSKSNGTIINISSLIVKDLLPGKGVYAASKAGISALSQTLAYEKEIHGVQFLTVHPGMIDTGLFTDNIKKALREENIPFNAQNPKFAAKKIIAAIEKKHLDIDIVTIREKFIVTIFSILPKSIHYKIKTKMAHKFASLSKRISNFS